MKITASPAFRQITTHSAITGSVFVVIRNTLGYTQSQVAEALGLTASTWSRIEKGDSALSVEQLRKVAIFLNIKPAHIFNCIELAIVELGDKQIEIVERFSDADTVLMNRSVSSTSTSIDLMLNNGILPIVGNVLVGLVSPCVQLHLMSLS